MDDAALRLLSELRETGSGRSVAAFAWIVLGCTPWEASAHDASRVEWTGERASRWAHQHAWLGRTEPYRVVHALLAPEPDRPCRGHVGAPIALGSLFALGRADRVALSLACVCGFAPHEVARVLGTDDAAAAAIIDGAARRLRAVRAA